MATGTAGSGQRLLVERAGELEVVDRVLEDAAAERGGVVLLKGPAGIGKTALLSEARARADSTGVVALAGGGGELETGFPWGVARQLLEPTMHAAAARRRARLLAGAAALARPVVLGSGPAARAPADQGYAIAHGLYWLVANLAAEAPLVLLVDDVHWADVPSLRFLVYLARRLEGLAASVLMSIRTGDPVSDRELVGELERSPGVRILAPRELSDEGVASVLAADFGRPAEGDFVRSCRRVTGGNPFLVRELASALVADGIAPTSDAAGSISGAAPETIARVAIGRLSRLSADAVALATAVAVLDRDARLPRAASLAGLDDATALAALDALVKASVLSVDNSLWFRHPIVRAAVYNDLRTGARSAAHRRAAALLAAEGAAIDAVAAHLLSSEPVGNSDTVATLRDAAAHALAVGAPENAAAYLSRALAEGPERELRATVLFELAMAEKMARRPTAAARFEEAVRLADDRLVRAQARIEQAEVLAYLGDWRPALIDQALSELPAGDVSIAARAETMRALVTAYDPKLADTFIERLPRLRQLSEAGDPEARPLTWVLAAWSTQRDERAEQVDELLARGLADGPNPTETTSPELLFMAVAALVMRDELDRAAGLVGVVRSAAQQTGSVLQYVVASGHAAWIENQRGNLVAATAEMRGCLARCLELELSLPAASTLSYCADVLLERTDVADLIEVAERMDLGPLSEVFAGAMLLAVRGRLRLAAGRRDDAIEDMRRAGAITNGLGLTNPAGFACWRSSLALMLTAADRDEALALARAESTDAHRSGQARRIGVALRALGLLEPDDTAADSHLDESAVVLADCPARLEYARSLVELGAHRRRHGERAAARGPLRDGLDLALHCGAARLAERARSELAAAGSRPRRLYATGRDALTPSEQRVCAMAAEGLSNPEIAQALFVTRATVESHLHAAYRKLDISSRGELAQVVGGERSAVPGPE